MNVVSIAAGLVLCAVVVWVFSQSSDPYGEFHLQLNKVEGSEDPRTEWLNMGYWKDTDVFPKACEALASKLLEAAELKPGANVLDVGHGSGESLIMLLQHPSVPRPSKLTGITSLPSHHKRSRTRVARLGQLVPVDLYLGDAIYRPACEGGHPLDPSSKAEFDCVLALDCAYHFNTRWTFLRQVYDQLKPGGSVALADICFARETVLTRFIRVMPRENMVSTDEYVAQMRRIGYTNVRLEDITLEVFPGFIKFLGTQGVMFRLFGKVMGFLAISGARFVIVRASK